jgi:hypothetical protein
MKVTALNPSPADQATSSELKGVLYHASDATSDGVLVTSALSLVAGAGPVIADGYFATGMLAGAVTSILVAGAFSTAALAVNVATYEHTHDLMPADVVGRWRKVGAALTTAFSLATGVATGYVVHNTLLPSGKNFVHMSTPDPDVPFSLPLIRLGKTAPAR